jgi:hypothetical protein
MSDVDDWYKEYLRQQEEDRRRSEQLVQYALPVLRFLGVTRVTVAFDGYGDDGEIKDPEYEGLPPQGLPEGLDGLLGRACGLALPRGWEINEGSFGTWTIDVIQGKTDLDQTHNEEEEDEDDEEEFEDEE